MRILAPWLALVFLAGSNSALAGDDLVSAHLYRGQLAEALDTARAAAEARPDDVAVQEVYIDLLLATGQPAKAASIYAGRVRVAPEDPDAHYLLGRALVDPEPARQAYERALRLDPDHARSHAGVGAIDDALGRLGNAEAAYKEALRRDARLPEAWLGLVRVLAQRGESAKALEMARRGLEANPGEPGLTLSVATLDPAHALEVLEAGAARSDDPRVHTRLSEVLLSAGQADRAAVVARRALATDPGSNEAERSLVFASTVASGRLDLPGLKALLDARDLLEADPAACARRLEAVAAKYPDAAVVFLAWAEALDRQGKQDQALSTLALALQRDPGLTDAQAAFGLALVRAGRHGEAVPWLSKAVATRPWDQSLVVALGRAQRQSGDLTGAVVTLEAASRARPWDVPTLITYAEALQAAGRQEAAYALLRDALRTNGDPRLAAGFVIAATAAGHTETAAAFLEDLGRKSGSAKLIEIAAQLRN